MAQRGLDYLIANPVSSHNYECRFSLFLLQFPRPVPLIAPEAGLLDPISVGDTESRNDVAFNQVREMTGSERGREVQEIVHRRLVGYLRSGAGEVGDDLCWAVPYCMSGGRGDWAMVWTSAKLLQSQAHRYRLTGDEGERSLARRIFEGLRRVACWDTGRAFFPGGVRPFREGELANGYEGCYPNVLTSLVDYWRLCRDPEGLEFAEAMAEGFLSNLQPGHLHKPDGHAHGHSHLQMHAIRGVAQLGSLTGNWRYLEWAKAAYDYYRAVAFDTGWLPEIVWLADHRNHSETCLAADMLECEVWFARAGRPRLWDRVDRAIRNYFSPAQFFVTEAVEAFWRRVKEGEAEEEVESGLAMLRELEGGFLAALTPNDRVFEVRPGGGHGGLVEFQGRRLVMDMMGCCPPEGVRAIYLAWQNVLQPTPHGILVNLGFDHEAPEATVRSGLPREGRLIVRAKVASDFLLRPPSWAFRAELTAWRNSKPVEPYWGGPARDYLVFRAAQPGETLEIAWPLISFVQRSTERFLESVEPERWGWGDSYTFRWIGGTVASVEPPGRWLPLYGERR
jgi:hypothetical protein